MNFVQKNGTAKALRDLNVRGGQPSTQSAIAGYALAGQILAFVGWVTDGDSVNGNAKWFKTQEGNYFWSGNVEVLPDPVPAPVGNVLTAAQLGIIIPALAFTRVNDVIAPLNNAMQEFRITTPLRQVAFIAQTAHESIGYSAFVENLNYSAQALLATWPSHFTAAEAASYARKPERIANRAYADRGGNGNEASGDGWKYRGRGIIQITFRDNYRACGTGLGADLVSHPELLEQPSYAFRSGAWFWNSRNLNPLADLGDFVRITRVINGGLNGLADRQRYYALAKAALGIS